MKNLKIFSGLNPDDYPSRKVAVAMSGGVDSSLTAILLKNAGFEVVGLTMRLWEYEGFEDLSDERGCCNFSTIMDAKKVASMAGIPHYTVNLREEFNELIVDNFVKEYISGHTPNPCVLCNKLIKWQVLREKARSIGFDLFATGHYARIAIHNDGTYSLLAGVDKNKDQSYFLWAVKPENLATTLFPLGAITKEETRNQAQKLNLKTADRDDSQEICFIPDNNYRNYIIELYNKQGLKKRPLPLTEGDILNTSGEIIGRHPGTAFYTIGQRKGIGISTGYPVYVTKVDTENNIITVGEKKDLLSSSMLVKQLNWMRGFPPDNNFNCMTRIRYGNPGTRSEVEITSDGATVVFDKPQSAVTPGQSAVFFNEYIVLGGGIIEKSQ